MAPHNMEGKLNTERCVLLPDAERAVLAGLLEDKPRPIEIDPESWRQLTHAERTAVTFAELGVILDAFPELRVLDALRWPRTKAEER